MSIIKNIPQPGEVWICEVPISARICIIPHDDFFFIDSEMPFFVLKTIIENSVPKMITLKVIYNNLCGEIIYWKTSIVEKNLKRIG